MTKDEIGKPLFETLSKQGRSDEELALIHKAYDFAYKAHDGQLRKSEDPYIIHPVEVACILAEINADAATLCSCLLHDVLEDCDVKSKEMEEAFGPVIVKIVEGVTKLGKFSFSSKEERQAENFRKLLVAMSEDVRVVLVKLADRLHNMRTLDHMQPHKQAEKAKETLEIYAPLANRFGLGRMKWELEDLGLKYLYPAEYKEIEELVDQSSTERQELLSQVVNKLQNELVGRNIQADIFGRPKHYFGIWRKMKSQQKTFQELYDVLAVRVIIDSNPDKNFCELEADPDTQKCYEVMGVVHAIFKPIPGRFKDYIGIPKFNSYQSLHTAVIGPGGKPVEIQIRTRRMHQIAEFGIAAHWRYKEAGEAVKADSSADKKITWLRQLVEWQQDLKDASEYLEEVKMDLFADEVFVFSPRGDVIDLPSGSTPIDFAYRIHTDIGHRCTGARLNDRIVPLNTVMKNGDIVDIITSKNGQPKMDWLNFAKTHGAKNRIRQWFKKHHREEHIQQGRQMLEAELGKGAIDEFFKSDKLKEVGRRLNISDPNDILAAVGYGDLSTSQVVNRLREVDQLEKMENKGYSIPQARNERQSTVSSLGDLLHHLAKCCQPVPGEEIVGVVTRGSGIAVHRSDCNNLSKIDEDRRMEVDWSKERHTSYPAGLQVECLDRVGIAGDILKKVSDNKVNLKDLKVETHRDKKTATIFLIVDVLDIDQLARVSQAISQISDVIRVHRKDHRKRVAAQANGNGTSNGNGKSASNGKPSAGTAKPTPIKGVGSGKQPHQQPKG
ncbi:MAG: bifunctional (p)ppGpp synthetase/guanosine-3',5'-bis(diphosphate) 3'-pyrophosphohydrolase [Cyanobacteria bacterium SZAS LIN-3]|nr:bifunctional (p)ppGpp synthetase/guanosine-3',5'-bis(diphosphate) 3'-pyrophosphohydrolase [Cyanobacteria bacterium SZAS LIN-3]